MTYIYVNNYSEHWVLARDVPSTSPSHGDNSGAHGEPYSKHICGFSTFMYHILVQRAWRAHLSTHNARSARQA